MLYKKDSETPLNERDHQRTPDYVFNYASKRWGPFEVDLAARADNTKCDYYYDEEINSLSVDWYKEFSKGWLNPPFSKMDPWIEKIILEAKKGFNTTMIMEIPNGEARMSSIFEYATEFVFIIGRVPYDKADGTPRKTHMRGSCLIHFEEFIMDSCRFDWIPRSKLEEYE